MSDFKFLQGMSYLDAISEHQKLMLNPILHFYATHLYDGSFLCCFKAQKYATL